MATPVSNGVHFVTDAEQGNAMRTRLDPNAPCLRQRGSTS